MRQFLVAAARPGAVLEFDGADFHYLVRVLRLRPGAVIPVADAAGRQARATVTALTGATVSLLVGPGRAGAAAAPGSAGVAAAAGGAGRSAPGGRTGKAAAAETGTSVPDRQAGAGEQRPAPAPAEPGNAVHAARRRDAAPVPAQLAGGVTLVQALPKGALMDRVVRQATELGVSRIVPVVAERSQGRADPAAQARRRQRWQRIARQAAQQSGSAPPAIEPPAPLRRYLERAAAEGVGLLFEPGAPLLRAAAPPGVAAAAGRAGPDHGGAGSATAAAPHRIPEALPDAARGGQPAALQGTSAAQPDAARPPAPAGPPTVVRCAVGPEGDFSPAEAALFREHGFHAVGLPGGILRVDTAVVAAITAARQFLASLSGP